jgi:hypothetical protein
MGPMSFGDFRRWILMESAELPPTLLHDQLKLRTECAMLKVEVVNKECNLVMRRQIQAILGLLNLHLDRRLNLSWRKTSLVILKAQRHGDTHARHIHEWTLKFLQTKALPLHRLGQAWWTALKDEDIASEIKLWMVKKSKKGFVKAEDIVCYVPRRTGRSLTSFSTLVT